MAKIRRCDDSELERIAAIINEAARAYRGVIPEHCLHEPYLSRTQLQSDIAAGVEFWGYEDRGMLLAVMGIQPVRDVHLIRHAYVVGAQQRSGVGSALLGHLQTLRSGQLWVGTWAAASWAIRFYQRHGFMLAEPSRAQQLLSDYWDIPPSQAAASVVLGARA